MISYTGSKFWTATIGQQNINLYGKDVKTVVSVPTNPDSNSSRERSP